MDESFKLKARVGLLLIFIMLLIIKARIFSNQTNVWILVAAMVFYGLFCLAVFLRTSSKKLDEKSRTEESDPQEEEKP